jgi:DNA polymerase I-like protein with 3'-5' exonuclease and polymerase domains
MDIYTIDTETFYSREFSLSKMTTEAYVRSPLFEVIGMGIKKNDGPTKWVPKPLVAGFLTMVKPVLDRAAILCHNTAFDGAILSWHYGIKPALWLDTLSMARPIHNVDVGGSLKALVAYYNLGAKGTEVVNALGKRYVDFSPAELAAYGEYCVNDVDLTYALYHKLKPKIPTHELLVIDQTIRMYTEPTIELDVPALHNHLANVETNRETRLRELADAMGQGADVDLATVQTTLMSNNNFATLLTALGVDPPMKTSPTTGKETYAFSKTDKGLTDLLEHPDDRVRVAVEARLGTKSSIERTRTEAFIGISQRGSLPIMLNYYGAHTGRFSGGDKVNLQNLPSRGNVTLRRALKAPEGHSIVACDSSQIEARTVAWLAGQDDLVASFAAGNDVYCEFASEIYGRTITKADTVERFIGKTCVAEGTLVLTEGGWKPIENVSLNDRVWDGVEWVCHQGLANNGTKKTLNICGAWLTPDHLVLSGTRWLDAQYLLKDERTLSQALGTGAGNLPSQAMYPAGYAACPPSSFGVIAPPTSTLSISRTSRTSKVLVVTSVLRKLLVQSVTGFTHKLCLMMGTGLGYLTDYHQLSLGATTLQTGRTSTMGSAGYQCTKDGAPTERRFFSMFRLLKGGMSRLSRWIGLTSTEITNPEISVLWREAQTCGTNDRSQTYRRVFDILNSGPRNRFTILTDAGPLIVHNCILGLGYGCGWAKFKEMLRVQSKVIIDDNEAQRIVAIYRQKYHMIARLWVLSNSALGTMLNGGSGDINGILKYDADGFYLPNGMRLGYMGLRQSRNGYEYINDARTYRKMVEMRLRGEKIDDLPWVRIFGPKVVENLVQALAGITVRDQMVKIKLAGYHVAFQVHDENVMVVPDDQLAVAVPRIERIMSTPPKWAPTLPVACESGVAKNYGDC